MPTHLKIPLSEAQDRIQNQIKKGYELASRKIETWNELRATEHEMDIWSSYNQELLGRIVDSSELQGEYRSVSKYIPNKSLPSHLKEFHRVLEEYIKRLESIYQRLELFSTDFINTQTINTPLTTPSPSPPRKIGNRVFIVHGHDEEAKQSVARCIEKLGFEAIILQEQPDQGRTIIEKFESYADVDFAVVLLTPDDVGAGKKDQASPRPRARQNVILELGFFIGKLGRKHVCALHKGDVELPSDFSGILWTRMDADGAWQFKLAREMKEAGLDVDVNKLF